MFIKYDMYQQHIIVYIFVRLKSLSSSSSVLVWDLSFSRTTLVRGRNSPHKDFGNKFPLQTTLLEYDMFYRLSFSNLVKKKEFSTKKNKTKFKTAQWKIIKCWDMTFFLLKLRQNFKGR